jgi:hypothetical protein
MVAQAGEIQDGTSLPGLSKESRRKEHRAEVILNKYCLIRNSLFQTF